MQITLEANCTKDPVIWKSYKAQRNKCKRLIQVSETSYWKENFDKSNSKMLTCSKLNAKPEITLRTMQITQKVQIKQTH